MCSGYSGWDKQAMYLDSDVHSSSYTQSRVDSTCCMAAQAQEAGEYIPINKGEGKYVSGKTIVFNTYIEGEHRVHCTAHWRQTPSVQHQAASARQGFEPVPIQWLQPYMEDDGCRATCWLQFCQNKEFKHARQLWPPSRLERWLRTSIYGWARHSNVLKLSAKFQKGWERETLYVQFFTRRDKMLLPYSMVMKLSQVVHFGFVLVCYDTTFVPRVASVVIYAHRYIGSV